MPENESINIDITGDVTEVTSSMEHALMSVEQVEEAAQRLTTQLAQIRTLTENPISLFDQDLATQIDLAERSANRLLDIRRNIDNSMSAESRESNTALLGNMITYTKQRVSDLNASVRQMNELQRAMGDLDASDFNQSMKTLYSGLKIGLRQYAEAMSKATGTQTPNAIIQGFMKTPEYKNVMAKAQSPHGNQHIFNDQNMQKYLASIATVAISPLTNNDYVDWTGQRRTINRVADLLPKQFSNIKLGRVATPTRDTTSSDFSEKLTKQELNTLQKIILQNQYVAREAEAARLITKHNGSIFMNKDATRGHVNAFAGNIAHLFSLGAMGLPMYGIEDIYDPKHLNSIASKTNKTITNARNMANILSEQYGEWLDPAYYSTLPDLPQNASSWYRAGQVKASGRKDRMQFLELALGEVGSDGQITFANGEPKYTPVVQSEYQNYLSKQKGATPFTHNGQNENEVFVKLPDEEAIQAVLDKDPTKETAIADEIARVIGTRISHNGKNYSFSGLTKTHAIFTDESIKQEIEKHDPNFFANGESARVFDDYEAFAKAATYNRLQRVEGEDIAELYGVDLDKLNVVVGNFKNLTGLDGQNFISNKLVPEGFQGRSFGGKATYSPFSVDWLFKQYANFVDTKSGNLILPGANVNGGDLVIPPNVDLIEDFSNIKTNKQYNATLSSEELAAIRKQEIADKGLFAKTTYDAAHTNSRFMSAQLANTMAFTPEARRYFTGVYMKELAAMQDPSAVIEKLFSGDDLLSQDVRRDITLLNSTEAQKRIHSYVDSLNEHIQKGDVLLPEGEGNYSMISAWLPDVINRTLVAGGKKLTSEQEAASLKDDVAYFLREATEVGLARNPATVNGNVEAVNKGADEYFKTLAKSIGVDENALYVDPSSVILQRLQGADEDGDTALVYAIKHSANRVFADVMKATLVNTAEQYKKIRERANLTDEEIEKRAASQTDKVDLGGQQSFSLNEPKDLARFWLEGRKGVLGMGAASAVTRNAFQLGISDRVAKAVLMAEKNYDINSTRDKTARVYLSSADERAMLSEGAPISSIMNWAMKSRTLDENDKMVAFDQEAFNREYAEKIAKSNFTSVNSSTGMQHAIAIWWAKNVEGADVSGGFDWDSIFANLPQEFDKDSAAGQLSSRLNDLRKQYIQGDFLVFGEKLEAELKQRSTDTYNEIRNQVNSDKSISEKDRSAEITRRYKAAGGEVVGHILQYGLTESNLLKNAEAFADVQSIIDIFGKENVYGSAVDYDSTYSKTRVDANNKQLEAQKQRKAELELEQRQYANANQEEIARLQAEIAELKAKDAEDKANQHFDGNLIGTIADKEAKLESLQNSKQAEIDQINAEIAKSESYQKQAFEFYRKQGEYERIIGGAEEFSRELWKSRRTKEAYINNVDPATLYYNKQSGIANAYIRQLNSLLETGGLDPFQEKNVDKQIRTISQGVEIDFMDKSISNAKHLAESLSARQNATSIDYDKSEHELDGYIKKLKEATDYQNKLLGLSQEAKENGRNEAADNIAEAARQTGEYIDAGYRTVDQLRHNLYTQDISGEDKMIDRLQRFTRDRNRRYSQSAFERQMLVNENDYEQYEQQYEAIAHRLSIWQSRRRGLVANGQIDTENYKLATQEINRLSSALSECQKEMDALSGTSGKLNAGLTVAGQAANRVVTQFGHRVFNQAVNEAKSFVVTYDAAMTEIQMVTLKTEDEISALGSGLIDKAVELRAGVGEVTSAATSLYRQGLNDSEVDARLEDVIKFSKTAKVSTTDSIKLATVAMNSGDVESTEHVFDVVSALGDSAATEAAEITKGLKKSLSAAASVGVSFEDLVAMLTVITSKTQLSGSVAGTTMRNVMSRMTRFGDQDSRYASQVQLLNNAGVEIFEGGEMRSVTKILSEIGALWESFDDRTKADIAYALGGTEQFSNVTALMQGFSETDENGVNLMQKYIELANTSDGITNQKYMHQIESLDGAMTNLRTTFDQLVASAENTGAVIDFLDFVADGVAGFADLNTHTEGLISNVVALTAALIGLAGLAKTHPYMLAMMGIAAGAVAIGKIGHEYAQSKKAPTFADRVSDVNDIYDQNTDTLSTAQKINEKRIKGQKISAAEEKELEQALIKLDLSGNLSFDGLKDSAGNAITTIDKLASSANATAKALDGASDAIETDKANRLYNLSLDASNEVQGSITQYQTDKQEYEERKSIVNKGVAARDELLNPGTFSSTTLEDYALTLLRSGALDSVSSDSLDGKTIRSLYNPNTGKYDEETFLISVLQSALPYVDFSGNVIHHDKDVYDALMYYTDAEKALPFTEDYMSFGTYNAEKLSDTLIGRDTYFAESGLMSIVVKGLQDEINKAYAASGPEGFNYNKLIEDLFYVNGSVDKERIDSFAKSTDEDAYLAVKKETEPAKYLSSVTRLSQSVDSAMASSAEADYEDSWIRMYEALRNTSGIAPVRLHKFANIITNDSTGIPEWDEMIRSKGSEALVNAWSSLVEVGPDKQHRIRTNVTDEELETFMNIIGSMSERTALMTHRDDSTVSQSASNVFSRLSAIQSVDDRIKEWVNLSADDATNKQMQGDLQSVLGEDLAYRFVNGLLDEEGTQYAQSLIDRAVAQGSIAPGDNAKNVQNMVAALMGTSSEQMEQFATTYAKDESLSHGMYAYNRIAVTGGTESDFATLGEALGLDAETVKRLSSTDEGKKLLENSLNNQISTFSSTLSDALIAMLPDPSILATMSGFDSDQIAEALSGTLSEGALSIIQMLGGKIQNGEFVFDVDAMSSYKSFADAANVAYENAQRKSITSRLFQAINESMVRASGYKDAPFANRAHLVTEILRQQYADLAPYWEDFTTNDSRTSIMWKGFESGSVSWDDFQKYLQDNSAYGVSGTTAQRSANIAKFLGEDWLTREYSEEDWQRISENMLSAASSGSPLDQLAIADFQEAMGGTGLDQIIMQYRELANGAQSADAGIEELRKNFNSDALAEQKGYLKSLSKVDKLLSDIASKGKDAASAYSEMHNEINNARSFKDALAQYKSGNRSEEVLNMLQSNSEYSADDLKKFKAGSLDYEVAISNLDITYDAAIDELEETLDNAFMPQIYNAVAAFEAANPGIEIDMGSLWVKSGYNLNAFVKMLQDLGVDISANVAALASQLSGVGIGINGEFDEALGKFVFNTDATGLKGSTSYRSGGSGGSKKSDADKLVERLGHGQSLYEHQIKMVQYEQTKYENADELGNYGRMLEEEIKIEQAYLPVLESNIAALRNELSEVKEGSEDWYKLRDAILEAEEQYADINNTIDENEKKLKENQQAILKLHTDLEEIVVGEIELRIENEKEMLDGSVSMQDIILNAVKQRYQDEWDLIKQDIDKKKEALQQEKDLIDERLDARREAEDEAAKYEELAELKKQLSLISMDSTRTKDAAALRESIAELEKEIGWDIAEKEAENEKNAIQDQIDAYDDYVANGDEDLDDLLSDANNFAEEVSGVLKLNQGELFEWLKQNVKEYTNSLDDAQKQMVHSWEATYKQMLGITDTYWDEVNAILSAKDTFLEYMKQSEEYIYASDDERAQLLYQWGDAYDKWRLAQKNNADYSHGDAGLGDWSGGEYTGSSSSGGSSGGSGGSKTDTDDTQTDVEANAKKYYVYDGKGNVSGPYSSLSRAETLAKQAADLGNGAYVKDGNGNTISRFTSSGEIIDAVSGADSNQGNTATHNSSMPKTGWPSYLNATSKHGYYYKITENGINVDIGTEAYATRDQAAAAAQKKLKSGQKYQTKYFLHGGIADFTGPAWLDGTPEEPERILSADQTRDFETLVAIMDDFRNSGVSMDVLRSMAKWSTSVNIPTSLSHIGNAAYQGNSANIGDIFVNITEAQISDDRDIEELANIVGQKFVKEIGKQGFNVSRYNF